MFNDNSPFYGCLFDGNDLMILLSAYIPFNIRKAVLSSICAFLCLAQIALLIFLLVSFTQRSKESCYYDFCHRRCNLKVVIIVVAGIKKVMVYQWKNDDMVIRSENSSDNLKENTFALCLQGWFMILYKDLYTFWFI